MRTSSSTHSPLYARLKKRLVALREDSGLTQRELAERMHRFPSVLCRIESGERRIDIVELFELCLAMGTDPKAVFESLAAEFIQAKASRVRAGKQKKTKVKPARKTNKPEA